MSHAPDYSQLTEQQIAEYEAYGNEQSEAEMAYSYAMYANAGGTEADSGAAPTLAVSEDKIDAFERGFSHMTTFKRKQMEAEAKKRKAEEEAARAYAEFVQSFAVEESSVPNNKMFVKGGIMGGDVDVKTAPSKSKPSLFTSSPAPPKPTPSIFTSAASTSSPSTTSSSPKSAFDIAAANAPSRKRKQPDKKRNIELFMQEMKQEKEDRAARIARRESEASAASAAPVPVFTPPMPPTKGSFHNGEITTNIYVGNLASEVTEQDIVDEFSLFGDLGSVKIMWPRTQAEADRKRNSGFVSFMKREDASQALDQLNGKMLKGQAIRLNWSKPVILPATPLVLKTTAKKLPALVQSDLHVTPTVQAPVFEIPAGAVKYQITIPSSSSTRFLIDHVASYVSRLCHPFEKLIMERESNNPRYSFLFNPSTPEHMYYRWRTYSLSQGDSLHTWRSVPFQMMVGGPFWIPPPKESIFTDQPTPTPTTSATPATTSSSAAASTSRQRSRSRSREKERRRDRSRERERERERPRRRSRSREREDRSGRSHASRNASERGKLSEEDETYFQSLLRGVTNERTKIRDVMGFALDHAEEAKEIVEILTDSLTLTETPVPKKLARLLCVSDILYNSSAPVRNASAYRSLFQQSLISIFESLHATYAAIDGRITANAMKEKVTQVLRVWTAWSLYPTYFTTDLELIFEGKPPLGKPTITSTTTTSTTSSTSTGASTSTSTPATSVETSHGTLLTGSYDSDEEVDGIPLTATTTTTATTPAASAITVDDDDVDGVPMSSTASSAAAPTSVMIDDDDVDGVPMT